MKINKKIIGTVCSVLVMILLISICFKTNDRPLTEEEKLELAWSNIYSSEFTENDVMLVSDEIEEYIQNKYVGKKDTSISMTNKDEYISINTANSKTSTDFYNEVYDKIKTVYKEDAKNWNIVVNETGDGSSVIYFLYTTK